MYKQNASTATCFEALIVRVPWPDFVDEIESNGYDNAKFLPVNLVDYTDGYDSECAVLFPETFSAHERPPAYFGAIFCDREAERLRRVAGAAAEQLHLNLPPDAACLLSSPELSEKAYILWDLIHDRTHMRGDLPFDPFMIRQRSPYWMYSLEELRCDLTAFGEAVKLEQSGFAFARYVQYAIVLDRLFRFPVTGSRVRNYDGLGGQLLFAFLHKEGYLHWTDSQLTIDWDRLAEGVNALRDRVQELYHSGIDRSKLSQWIAAHDLVATYVPPAENSVWAAEQPRAARGGGAQAARRPRPRRRVPAEPLLLAAPAAPRACARGPSQPQRHRRACSFRGVSPTLEGRTVAIAGAGGGLGPDVAKRLAAEGATLALTDIDVGRLEELANELDLPQERIDFRTVDLLDADSTRHWCDHLEERFGGTDALVHLVGGWKGGDPIASTPLADYEWLHNLLVETVQHASRAFYDALAESQHGRFVLVSSAQAQAPDGTNASYAATKAAAESWTLALADSFRKDESAATANIIVINAILTPQMRADNPDKPYKTFTSTEDIADAIAFTLSDRAAKMNGKRLALHP